VTARHVQSLLYDFTFVSHFITLVVTLLMTATSDELTVAAGLIYVKFVG